jgi:hypothetical protein
VSSDRALETPFWILANAGMSEQYLSYIEGCCTYKVSDNTKLLFGTLQNARSETGNYTKESLKNAVFL